MVILSPGYEYTGHIGYYNKKSDGSWGEKFNDISGNHRYESNIIVPEANSNFKDKIFDKDIAVTDDKIVVRVATYILSLKERLK